MIVRETVDVERRLLRLFGTTRGEWIEAAALAASARADAVAFDALSAPGTFAYLYGLRAVRALLMPKGFKIAREDNIEASYSAERALKVVYQNADSASIESRSPRAITAKGPAGIRMVDETQACLFPEIEAEERRLEAAAARLAGAACWFFLVHIDGEDVRAELSLPILMEGGQFKRFVERISILNPGDWTRMRAGLPDDAPLPEFEISVTRKR